MTDRRVARYSFDGDPAEHLLFLDAVVTIVADGAATGDVLTVTEIDAPPRYENNLHSHPPAELFYVLSGEMTLYVDREAHHLTPGTTGFVPPGRPHGFRVVGDEPLRVVATFVPGGMAEFFREVGTPVDDRTIPDFVGATEADLERMAAASPTHGIRRLGPLPA